MGIRINGVDSFVLFQNVKMGHMPSNETILELITLCEESARMRDQRDELLAALKAYQRAGFGESASLQQQSYAYNLAVEAISKAEA